VMTVTHNAEPTTTHYAYDSANRLTSIQLPDSSIQVYTWDNRGNLLADGTFTYTYRCNGLSSPENCTILDCVRSQASGA